MEIGGLQKSSLIDYPGKVSCVIFLSGCNWNCPFCHNAELVQKKLRDEIVNLNKEVIYQFLELRKKHLDGVVISGGEPTLQKGLLSFCEDIKNMGYSIKLDTNGSNPNILFKIINEGLIDYVAMDIKTELLKYPVLLPGSNQDDIRLSAYNILDSGINYEFRTTCVGQFVDEQSISRISSLISGAKLYILQKVNTTKVLKPEFFANNQNTFTLEEIKNFQKIAEQYVQKCTIR